MRNSFLFLQERNTLPCGNSTEQASKLLNFDQKLDITLLDSIVGFMYSGADGEQVSVAKGNSILFHTKHSILIYYFTVLFNAFMVLLFPSVTLKE